MAIDSAQLEREIRLAATWCADKNPGALRTPELRPDLPELPEVDLLERAITNLSSRRQGLLSSLTTSSIPVGRILICEFNGSVMSGESRMATDGFFDVADRPPWDTWIACEADQSLGVLLYSFVPQALVQLVTRGIETNPYQSIYWLRAAENIAESSLPKTFKALGFE